MESDELVVKVGPLDAVEQRVIEAAIALEHGNKKKAAERLGISRSALYAKLKRHALDGLVHWKGAACIMAVDHHGLPLRGHTYTDDSASLTCVVCRKAIAMGGAGPK